MTIYNPNNPTVAGSEWFPSASVQKRPGVNLMPGILITATATETVDQIMPFTYAIDTTPPAGATLVADVYDLTALGLSSADDLCDNEATKARRQIAPVANGNTPTGWEEYSGGSSAYGSTAYTFIDDAVYDSSPLSSGNADFLRYTIPNTNGSTITFKGGSTFISGEAGASVANLTGLRVTAIRVVALVGCRGNNSATVYGVLNIGGEDFRSSPQVVLAAASGVYERLTFDFKVNPSTGQRWNLTDAQTFVATATSFFGVHVQGTPKANVNHFNVMAMALEFETVTEQRVAVASAALQGRDMWLPLTCKAPASDATQAWSKTNAHLYYIGFVTPRVSSLALGGVSTALTAGREDDAALFSCQELHLTGSAIPHSALPATNEMLACVLDSPASADSQPYASVATYFVGAGTASPRQKISNESASTYGTATVLVRTTATVQPGVADQDDALTLTLKKVSDNSVLMAATDIAAAAVPPDGKFHVVQLRMPSAALTSALAVYLEASSSSTVPWEVIGVLHRGGSVLSTDTDALLAASVGIQGTTAAGAGLSTTYDSTLDFPWNIGTVPATPSLHGTTLASFPNQQALGSAVVPRIYGASLSWLATSLGASFARYEIERFNLTLFAWEQIAWIEHEASAFFNDFEGMRNAVASVYRVRVVRTDGQASDWATFNDAPAIPTSDPADIILTSNFDPTLTVAGQDHNGYTYRVNDQENVVRHRIAGRKNPVQFAPAGDGEGDVFTRVITLAGPADTNVSNAPTGLEQQAGRRMFDHVLDLARATSIPYVAVLDGRRGVWYCGIVIKQLINREPGNLFEAEIEFAEVASAPALWIGATPPTVPT